MSIQILVNNLMNSSFHCHNYDLFSIFRHDEEDNPLKVILLDVAISRWSSPCVDLSLFLYSCTTPLLRETHMDDMLGHYHDTLVRCLAELGHDPALYTYRYIYSSWISFSYEISNPCWF